MNEQNARVQRPPPSGVMARLSKHIHRLGIEPDRAIARDAVVSVGTVGIVRRFLGITAFSQGRPSSPPKTPQARARETLGSYADELGVKDDAQIARATGYSSAYIAALRRKCNIAPSRRRDKVEPQGPEAERIRLRLGEHFDRLGVDLDVDIARDAGYTTARIQQFRAAMGIPRATPRIGRKIEVLRAKGTLAATLTEVAEQVGATVTGVRRYMPADTPHAPAKPFQGEDTPGTRAVLPLLATHTNHEIAALTGLSEERVMQIRTTWCIPSPRRTARSRCGKRSPTFEDIIERASCALGCDVNALDTANLQALARKHGVSVGTLRLWRAALFNCGFFERARKNACGDPG